MPFSVCLQDWICVQGFQQSVVVTQPEPDYVDVLGYQDLAVYVEIAQDTNTTLSLQTSPTPDASFFVGFKASGGAAINWTTSGLQAISTMRIADNGTPLLAARFLRWTATGTNNLAWSISFRIWLSLNQAAGTG